MLISKVKKTGLLQKILDVKLDNDIALGTSLIVNTYHKKEPHY